MGSYTIEGCGCCNCPCCTTYIITFAGGDGPYTYTLQPNCVWAAFGTGVSYIEASADVPHYWQIVDASGFVLCDTSLAADPFPPCPPTDPADWNATMGGTTIETIVTSGCP
jgi:hypothetical protein